MYSITFKGKSSEQADVKVTNRPNIPAASKRIETVVIPNRSGALHIDNGDKAEIVITINMNFKVDAEDEWMEQVKFVNNWLNGSGKLQLSDMPNQYYNVSYVQIDEFKRTNKVVGSFNAKFYCDPYIYYDDALIDVIAGTAIFHMGYSEAHPLFEASINGQLTIAFDNKPEVVITGNNTKIIIDTDLQIAYASNGTSVVVEGNYEDLWIKTDCFVRKCEGGTVKMNARWRS